MGLPLIMHLQYVTVFQLTKQQMSVSDTNWISIIGQLLEAVAYLHTKAEILHNHISCSNIVLTNSKNNTVTSEEYQIVLIDFGKATKLPHGKQYHLSSKEKKGVHTEISSACSRSDRRRL